MQTTATRHELIRNLWPDKTFQASLLLMLSAGASLIFYLERAVFDIKFSESVPSLLRAEASQVMAFLALVAGILAYVAVKRTHVGWAWAAAAMSAVSVGPLGIGVLCAIAASVFLVLAQREGEHTDPDTRSLSRLDWPDKAFGASLVLLLAGLVAILWGASLVMGAVSVTVLPPVSLGVVSLLAGAGMIAASVLARREKMWWACLAASIAAVLTIGLYVVGPLLGMVAIMFLILARVEDEFQ